MQQNPDLYDKAAAIMRMRQEGPARANTNNGMVQPNSPWDSIKRPWDAIQPPWNNLAPPQDNIFPPFSGGWYQPLPINHNDNSRAYMETNRNSMATERVAKGLPPQIQPKQDIKVPGLLMASTLSSTPERTGTFNIDGREVILPTMVGGVQLTNEQAFARFNATGEHLGMFDSPESAEAHSIRLGNGQVPQ